jgi:hypothetical protein
MNKVKPWLLHLKIKDAGQYNLDAEPYITVVQPDHINMFTLIYHKPGD